MARTDLEQLQFQMAADIRTLTKQMQKAEKQVKDSSGEMQGHLDSHPLNYNRFVGDPGKAFNNVVRRSRLGAIEEGGAKIPIFGSALEDLGVAGIAAGAGLLITAEAAEKVHEAMKFANEVDNASRRLHVGTDAVQEYRFALEEAGGTAQDADQSIEDFASNVGKAQEGLTKSLRAFKALGFSKEQVKSFSTVEQALDAVVEKIAGLKSDVQKDAVIDQLGLKGMKPLIEQGVEKMRELKAEAKSMGLVMDADMVKRGAELNRQFEALSKVISVQLKEALIDLAPLLVGLIKMVAGFARELNASIQGIRGVEERSASVLQQERQTNVDRLKDLDKAAADEGHPGKLSPAQQSIADARRKTIADIDAELAKRKPEAPPIPHGGASLIDQSKPKTPKANGTADAISTAERAADDAEKRLAEAKAALAGDVEEHARLERQALAAESAKRQEELAQKARSAATDETIDGAHKDIIYWTLLLASMDEDAALAAKKQKIDRDATAALAERELQSLQAMGGYSERELAAKASLARTAAERAKLELQALKDRQSIEVRAESTSLNKQVAAGEISPDERDRRMNALQDAQISELRKARHDNLGPLDAWRDKLISDATDVQTAMENLEIKGIEGFNDALARSIVEGKNWRDSFRSLVKDLELDFVKMQEKRIEASLFGAPSLDPRHSAQVLLPDNAAAGGLGALGIVNRLSQLGSVAPGSFAAPAPIQQDFHLHADGAVMTEDLISGLVRQANTAASTAASGAIDFTKRSLPAWLASFAAETGFA